jgi:hypothetical protein
MTCTPRNQSIKIIRTTATIFLNLKPFKFTNVQKLQDPNCVARVQFCDWFCEADSCGEVDHCQRTLELILLKLRVNKPRAPGRSGNYVLYGGARFFSIIVSLLLLPYKMCITSHPQAERASNRAVHSSLQNGESYHRTCFISPPRIRRFLQNFWKMCGPLT